VCLTGKNLQAALPAAPWPGEWLVRDEFPTVDATSGRHKRPKVEEDQKAKKKLALPGITRTDTATTCYPDLLLDAASKCG
jgi:hypothetical protein